VAFDASDPVALDGPWPLVGHNGVFERALAALRGTSRTVVLHGPSGVGRSRVAAEVASTLEDEGWLTATVAGNPALPPMPLSTIAPVLPARGGASIAEAEDGDALFTAASALLTDLGQGRRSLVVLDDAAAADPVSTRLIARLVEEDRIRVLATVGAADAVPDGMLRILDAPDATRLEVRELDAEHTERLLALVLGAPVAAGTVWELHRASSGNPLHLRELVIRAGHAGTLVREPDQWRLVEPGLRGPDAARLRELIHARLRELTHEERDVVERLSLCQPLALDEFARPGAPEAIADLEQRGLLRIDETRDRIQMMLAHPEYAAAARETISRARHVTLLAQQADQVARRSPSPADELRVALWRLVARRPSDPQLLLRSARLAEEVGDHRCAERLVSAAITAGADSAEDHLLHAGLLRILSRDEEALSALDRAEERGVGPAVLAAIARQRAEITKARAREV
jgi:hypothetical protein